MALIRTGIYRQTGSEIKSCYLWKIFSLPVEKSLALCKRCSATTRTLVYYQHYSHPKSQTLHHVSPYRENYLDPSQNPDRDPSSCSVLWTGIDLFKHKRVFSLLLTRTLWIPVWFLQDPNPNRNNCYLQTAKKFFFFFSGLKSWLYIKSSFKIRTYIDDIHHRLSAYPYRQLQLTVKQKKWQGLLIPKR